MNGKEIKLTRQQERFLKLLYKFRYVNTTELAKVLGIRIDSVYDVLETLKRHELVTKVYKNEFRLDRKPAYYYLSKSGVTAVRKLLGVKESVVHALYKETSDEFIAHCQTTLAYYNLFRQHLPAHTEIFTKTEINQDSEFPKNRPDLYIRTPDNHEYMVLVLTDALHYIINKRIDEIIAHSEEEGWDGDYPTIAVIVNDAQSQNRLLYKTKTTLENMGMAEDELTILISSLDKLQSNHANIWANVFKKSRRMALYH